MQWIILVFVIFCLSFILLMFSTLHIHFHLFHRNDNSDIRITLRIYRFVKYTLHIPLVQVDAEDHAIKIKEEKKASLGQKKDKKKRITFDQLNNQYTLFNKTLLHVQNLFHIIRHFLSKMKLSDLQWHSAIGLGDASSSAVAAGAAWGVKGIVLQVMNSFFQLQGVPSISVVPVFQALHSETRFSCMVSFKIGHAIVVMLKIVKAWRKSKRSSQVNTEYMTGGV
ncbi:DUF2953 domain-containing protein [Fictibacillus nanhaiensis]|uniref:DUF2953 domain-containing protein n=1 Tax=Fictibacillus nanhaiensis TaxID=742169 RepID=UPI001C98BA9A|nr:DUF2953 domain-containing protein [Fictibacillus nanhaiensis]MBY6035183.1 DUF2953 domain-containing protein [Fictibacillus nanhaiensis]